MIRLEFRGEENADEAERVLRFDRSGLVSCPLRLDVYLGGGRGRLDGLISRVGLRTRLPVRNLFGWITRSPRHRGVVLVLSIALVVAVIIGVGAHENPVPLLSYLLLVPAAVPFLLLLITHRLCRIYVFLLEPDEPFPIISPSRKGAYIVLAARLLEPNLARRIKKVRAATETLYSGDVPKAGAMPAPFLRFGDLVSDFWMLVRFAINRYSPSQQTLAMTEEEASRSMYFTYKLHLTQLKWYFLLVGVSVIVLRFTEHGHIQHLQLTLLFGAAAVAWVALSIATHRISLRKLTNWEENYKAKPFSSSPIFLYDPHANPAQRWEELVYEQFESAIQEYGMSHNELMNLVLAVLLVAYLALLHVVK